MTEETLCALALTRLNYFNLTALNALYQAVGSARGIVAHRADIEAVVPEASPRLVESLRGLDDALRRAEDELSFCQAHGIEALTPECPAYPQRMRNCADAPLVLFYRGNADINQQRVVSIVGTRHCTTYGQDLIRRFMADLRALCPRVLIVSGLAYGVDIHAHRAALDNGYDTVGVLAHGLDDLYPRAHRETASRMLAQGGLLTEFWSGTNADKVNFVRRNRIVAGMSDATILVESAAKGGGLITTGIAREYGRDVFAFPGPVSAPYSEGCNNLIRDNGAGLISSASDFVKAMGWQTDGQLAAAQSRGIERQMFPDLSADEQRVVDVLRQTNDLQINILAVKSGIAIGPLAALLFQLEMKGVLKAMAGGMYHLFR